MTPQTLSNYIKNKERELNNIKARENSIIEQLQQQLPYGKKNSVLSRTMVKIAYHYFMQIDYSKDIVIFAEGTDYLFLDNKRFDRGDMFIITKKNTPPIWTLNDKAWKKLVSDNKTKLGLEDWLKAVPKLDVEEQINLISEYSKYKVFEINEPRLYLEDVLLLIPNEKMEQVNQYFKHI